MAPRLQSQLFHKYPVVFSAGQGPCPVEVGQVGHVVLALQRQRRPLDGDPQRIMLGRHHHFQHQRDFRPVETFALHVEVGVRGHRLRRLIEVGQCAVAHRRQLQALGHTVTVQDVGRRRTEGAELGAEREEIGLADTRCPGDRGTGKAAAAAEGEHRGVLCLNAFCGQELLDQVGALLRHLVHRRLGGRFFGHLKCVGGAPLDRRPPLARIEFPAPPQEVVRDQCSPG